MGKSSVNSIVELKFKMWKSSSWDMGLPLGELRHKKDEDSSLYLLRVKKGNLVTQRVLSINRSTATAFAVSFRVLN